MKDWNTVRPDMPGRQESDDHKDSEYTMRSDAVIELAGWRQKRDYKV
jgi:hypothetical protein